MSHLQPYPRQPHEGVPEPTRRRTVIRTAAAVVGLLAGLGLVVGTGFLLLWAANPMGDEWICSDGEAPAGKPGHYNICYVTGEALPRGVEWDPWGNRPMPYNCDKDGWVQIERTPREGQSADVDEDCVREGTELPGRWHVVDED